MVETAKKAINAIAKLLEFLNNFIELWSLEGEDTLKFINAGRGDAKIKANILGVGITDEVFRLEE